MWTTVYVAIGRQRAENVEKLAIEEGFYMKKRYFGKEGNDELFEIITLESEAEEFYKFLQENNIV